MLKKLRTQMRLIMIIVVVAFLLSTFLMYEGRSRRTPRLNADGTIADYEVAEVNGRSVMRSELERRVRRYVESTRQRNVASLDMPTLYQTVLDQYVLEAQMAREVDAQGIRISDVDAENAMKAYADRFFPTREAFYQYLSQIGLKTDDYKRAIAVQMANERLVQNAIGEIIISDDEAAEFYDTMKSLLYFKPEGFMVHLANLENSADAQELHDAITGGKTWSEAISNDRFAKIDANNLTRDPIFLPQTTFASGPLMPLLSLDIGEISPIFSISSGDYSLGLKESRVSESITPYDEVSGDIKLLLRQQQERVKLQEFQNSLMEKAQIAIYDTSLFPQPSSDDSTAGDEEEFIIDDENAEDEATSDEVKEIEEIEEIEKIEETEEVAEPEATPEEKIDEAVEPELEEETEPVEKTVEAQPEEKPEDIVEAAPEEKTETAEETVETTPEAQSEEAVEAASEEKPEVVEETIEAQPDDKPEEIPDATSEEKTEIAEETVEAQPEEKPEAIVEAISEEKPEPVEETIEAQSEEKPEETLEKTVEDAAEKEIEEISDEITGKLQKFKIPEVHSKVDETKTE